MDKDVLAAMARWPDVPDVYGWLSLSEQGQWRLHPDGDPQAPGELIDNQQILRFIDRNYSGDALGRWFFQNGPQRVFVRLDAAPLILHTMAPEWPSALREQTDALRVAGKPTHAPIALYTHNGLPISSLDSWWLDTDGRLFVQTGQGPGLIAGRDLPSVLDALITQEGQPLGEQLEPLLQSPPTVGRHTSSAPALLHVRFPLFVAHAATSRPPPARPFHLCNRNDIPARLGFVLDPAQTA